MILSRVSNSEFLVFFFQAEDGIRDYKVTGVQTCALPISRRADARRGRGNPAHRRDLAASVPRARARGAPAWPALRLRLEAGLSPGHRGVRRAPPGNRQGFRALPEDALD